MKSWRLQDFESKKIIGKFNREKKLLAKNTVFCVKYYNCNTFTLLHTGTRAGRASVEKQHITPLSPRFDRSAHRELFQVTTFDLVGFVPPWLQFQNPEVFKILTIYNMYRFQRIPNFRIFTLSGFSTYALVSTHLYIPCYSINPLVRSCALRSMVHTNVKQAKPCVKKTGRRIFSSSSERT